MLGFFSPQHHPLLEQFDSPGSQSIILTGTRTFVVPKYKNTLTITLWGAGAGGGSAGGNGARGQVNIVWT